MKYEEPAPVILDEKDAHYYVTMGCKECGKAWTVDLPPGMVTRDTCPACDSMKVWEIRREATPAGPSSAPQA